MKKIKSVKMAKEILKDINIENKYTETEKIEIYLQILDYNLLGYNIKKYLTDNQIKDFFNIFERNKDVQINLSKNRMSFSLLDEVLNLMSIDKKIDYFNLLLDSDVDNDFTKTIFSNIKNNENNKKIEISINKYNKLIGKYTKTDSDINLFDIKYTKDDLINLENLIINEDMKKYKDYYPKEIINQLNLIEYENKLNKLNNLAKKNELLKDITIHYYDIHKKNIIFNETEVQNKINGIIDYNNDVIQFNDNELLITKDDLLKIKEKSYENIEDIYKRFMFPIKHILREMNYYLSKINNDDDKKNIEKENKIFDIIKQEYNIEEIKNKYMIFINEVINKVDNHSKIKKNKM